MTNASAAAAILQRARRRGERLEAWPAGMEPRTLAEGYAIQAALAAGLRSQTGWKLSATGPEPQRRLGIEHPLFGRLTADRELAPGKPLSVGRLCDPILEPEIAFVMGRRLGPGGHDPTEAAILDAVKAVRLAVEVPDAWFRDRGAVAAPAVVADNAWAGHYLLGPWVAGWRELDLAAAPVVVRRDGTEVAAGSGALISAGPVACLLWLARELRAMGLPLDAGQVVITGTCTWPVPVSAGDVLEADFGALGSLSLAFEP